MIEPYKIKTVEALIKTTREHRKKILLKAHLNLFLIDSRDVMIDLLTDSGTNAMSAQQWAALMQADESYAGSSSFYNFKKSIQEITGHSFVIPTHQGRSAERILLRNLKSKKIQTICSNMLFDTTRANAVDFGFQILDCPCSEYFDNTTDLPFKGNIDLEKLETHLKQKNLSAVIMTVTNNSAGGQPVSMENLKAVKQLCETYSTPMILDACRFAENAWFIKQREQEFKNFTTKQIAKSMFELADVAFVSAKKDGLANIGGFISTNHEDLTQSYKNRLILEQGFPSYGGLAGRDLEAIAVGLKEALEESYLEHRTHQVYLLHKKLKSAGISLIQPAGGHAVYIDAKKTLPHIDVSCYPAQSLVSALYEWSGIRSCAIDSVMFGTTLVSGEKTYHSKELVRLCIPRRVYTQSHLDYVADSIISFIKKEASQLKGVKFSYEPPFLRHFTAHFTKI